MQNAFNSESEQFIVCNCVIKISDYDKKKSKLCLLQLCSGKLSFVYVLVGNLYFGLIPTNLSEHISS